jgi:hypothetical protein
MTLAALTWKQAALLISPLLAPKEPEGFAGFTPDAWLDWAVRELAAPEARVTVVTLSDLPPELEPLLELLRKPDGPAH